ncbi:cytidyltransferase [Haematococcus lacustris]|uniref:Cytidyltransferase n=1 Tax=Haematococcus lacustris TaxID=44745 RepID=A0A699YRH1_HAELA|nr:cytidyltransferase [Haematococcus lacustris]
MAGSTSRGVQGLEACCRAASYLWGLARRAQVCQARRLRGELQHQPPGVTGGLAVPHWRRPGGQGPEPGTYAMCQLPQPQHITPHTLCHCHCCCSSWLCHHSGSSCLHSGHSAGLSRAGRGAIPKPRQPLLASSAGLRPRPEEGGSAAYALLQGRDSVQSELDLGVGWQVGDQGQPQDRQAGRAQPAWHCHRLPPPAASQAAVGLPPTQDPAIISETGLCVWRSGQRPELDFKTSPAFLSGALLPHCVPGPAGRQRHPSWPQQTGSRTSSNSQRGRRHRRSQSHTQ